MERKEEKQRKEVILLKKVFYKGKSYQKGSVITPDRPFMKYLFKMGAIGNSEERKPRVRVRRKSYRKK